MLKHIFSRWSEIQCTIYLCLKSEMDANAEYLRLLLLKHDSVQVACFKNYANHIREQPLCQTTVSINLLFNN